MRKVMIDVQPHRETRGMESRRDDSSKFASRGLLGIDMKILRIESPRELDDLGFAHRDCPELVYAIGRVVFEISVVSRYSEAMQCHEKLPLPREKVGSLRTGKHSTLESDPRSSTHSAKRRTPLHRDHTPPKSRAASRFP